MYTTDSEMGTPYKGDKSLAETPTVELSCEAQLPESTNCLCCSEDGKYLSLGHSSGVSVWCVSSLICVADWSQDSLEITYIQMTRMAEMAYLLGTVDAMGVARVFAYHCDRIHLLSVVNIMEDVNNRSICLTFELSEGGHYAAASLSCNDDVWLDVYHFPLEAWLEELKIAASLVEKGALSGEVNVKWSPLSVAAKIKPPHISEALKGRKIFETTDLLAPLLALDIIKGTTEGPKRSTQHFLLPFGQFPGDRKAQPELPVAVCVWWSGSYNLLQYVLQKDKKKKPNVESVPEVLLANAKKIICSAVSRCARYIALGLEDALVFVWDRQFGCPLSLVVVSAADSFLRMHFVDFWPVSADDYQTSFAAEVHLLVVCKSGETHTLTTGSGTQSSTVLLTERPDDSRDFPTITTSVPFLQGVSLVVQRNGKMFLQDAINNKMLCSLIPPTTHWIATPCNPVYALNGKQQTLFIRGDRDLGCNVSPKDNSQLLVFHFAESDITKQYCVSPSHSPQQNTRSFSTLEERLNLYLQQRALTAPERNKAIKESWKRLQESAEVEEKRHSRAADS